MDRKLIGARYYVDPNEGGDNMARDSSGLVPL